MMDKGWEQVVPTLGIVAAGAIYPLILDGSKIIRFESDYLIIVRIGVAQPRHRCLIIPLSVVC